MDFADKVVVLEKGNQAFEGTYIQLKTENAAILDKLIKEEEAHQEI